MVSETLELIIRTSGTSESAQSIRNIETSAANASRSVSSMAGTLSIMRSALVALSFARVFEGVAAGITQMQEVNNLLSTITRGTKEQYLLFQRLADAATAVRAPVEAFAQLFTNLTRSSAGYKLSTDEAIKATQTFFATFAISGLDNQSIRNLSRDMKEVFNQGVVQGRIFRSIVMQDQQEALILSKYIVATGTNAAKVNKELAAMRAKGQQPNPYELVVSGQARGAFTATDIVNANLKAYNETMGLLAGTTVTFSQAMTILNNDWLKFLSYLQNSSGMFNVFTNWLVKLGDYIPEIALFVAAIGGMLVINLVATAFTRFGSVVAGIFGFILTPARVAVQLFMQLAGSVERFGGAVVGVAGGAVRGLMSGVTMMAKVLTGSFSEAATALTTIGRSAVTVGSTLLNVGVGVASALVTAVPLATVLVAAWMTVKKTINDLTPAFNGVIAKAKQLGLTAKDIPLAMETGFTDAFSHWAEYEAMFKALWDYVKITFISSMGEALNWVIVNGLPMLASAIGKSIYNLGVSAGNMLRSAFGLSGPGMLSYAGINMGNIAGQQKNDVAAISTLMNSIGTRVATETATLKSQIASAAATRNQGSEPGGTSATKDMSSKIDAAKKSLADLLGGYGGEWNKFQKDWDVAVLTIDKARKVLGATATQAIMTSYGFKTLNDLEVAQIDKVLGVKNGARDFADTQKLVNAAVAAGSKEIEQYNKILLAKKIAELEDSTTLGSGVQAAYLKAYQSMTNYEKTGEEVVTSALQQTMAMNKLAVGVQALQMANQGGIISNKQMDSTLRDLQLDFLKTQTDMSSGFVVGMLDVQKSLQNTATDATKTITDMFNGMTEAMTTFIDTGKLNIRSFLQQIVTDFTTMFVKQQIMGPLANMLGFGQGQTSGTSPLTGLLSSVFGGTGSLPGIANASSQLGSSANPMYVLLSNSAAASAYDLTNSPLVNGFTNGNGATGSVGGVLGAAGMLGPTSPQAGATPPSGLMSMLGLGGNPATSPGLLGSSGMFGLTNSNGLLGSTGFVNNMVSGTGGGAGSLSSSILGMFGGVSGAASGSTGGLLSGLGGLLGMGGSSAGVAGAIGGGGAAAAGGGGIFSSIFGGLGSMLGLGGSAAGAAAGGGGILSMLGSILPFLAFANGGAFQVGGQGGTDSQLVAFRASPDETVHVTTPHQTRSLADSMSGGGPNNLHLHLHGVTDADSFNRNKTQVAAGFDRLASRAMKRNGKSAT